MSRRSARLAREVLTDGPSNTSNAKRAKAMDLETQGVSDKTGQQTQKAVLKPISVLYEDLKSLTARQGKIKAEVNAATGAVAAAKQALEEAKIASRANNSTQNKTAMKAAQTTLNQAKNESRKVIQKASNLKRQIERLNATIAQREASGGQSGQPALEGDSDLTDLEALTKLLDDISESQTDPSHASAMKTSLLRTAGKERDQTQQATENSSVQESLTSPEIESSRSGQEILASAKDTIPTPLPVPESTTSPALPKSLTPVASPLHKPSTQQISGFSDDGSVPVTRSDVPAISSLSMTTSTTSLLPTLHDSAGLFTPGQSPEPTQPATETSAPDPPTPAGLFTPGQSPEPTQPTIEVSAPDQLRDPANLFTPEPSPEPSQPAAETSIPNQLSQSQVLPTSPALISPEILESKASLSGEDELDPESGTDTLRPPKVSKTRKHIVIDSDDEDQAAPRPTKKAKVTEAPKRTRSRKRKAAEDNDNDNDNDNEGTQAPKKRIRTKKEDNVKEQADDDLVVLKDGETLPPAKRRPRDSDKKLLPPPDLTKNPKFTKIKKIYAWLKKAVDGVGPSAIEDVSKTLGIRTMLYESASILPELVTTSREIALAALVSADGNLICRYHTISDKSRDKPGAVDGDDNTLYGRPWPWMHGLEKKAALDDDAKARAAAAKAAQDSEELLSNPELLSPTYQTPGWKVVESRGRDKTDCGCYVQDVLLEVLLWKTGKLTSPTCDLVDDWRADFLDPRQRALVCKQYREGTLLDVDDLYSLGVENGRWVRRSKVYHRRVQAERALKIVEAEAENEKAEEVRGDAEITASMHS
ncbi:hypothetical protein VNI00_017849 [Paramarasmius palmivorus]|uniref:Ubiquitin-like protease family profile domain-containing protein n=1 Tax=Paramarasmius palmivorus TaxID=297713 RepID=A0AAW0B3D5_9AGAR